MKKLSAGILVSMIVMAGGLFAAEIVDNYNFRGEVNFDAPCRWKINATRVTATAAELNQLDGNAFTSITITGDVTIVTGTQKVDKVEATLAGFTGASIAGLPKDSFTFMDDFHTIITHTNVTEATTLAVPWKYTGDTADSVAKTVGATAGGILTFLTGSTDNNEAYMQYGPLGTEGSFVVTSNSTKKVWFEARILAAPQAHEGGFFVGLADPASAAANFLVDDSGVVDTNKNFMGFWIGTTSSNAYYEFCVNKADAAAALYDTQIITNTAATYVRLGFLFDGVRTTTVYVNGTAKTRVHTNNAVSYPNAVVMSPIVAIKTGLASTINTGKVDYIWAQQER
jgi:hypothetical protein